MTNENFLAGEYKAGFFPTRDFLGGLNLKDPAQFKESDVPEEYAAANFNASEQIKAGYAMLTQHFGEKWIVVAGVRVENTIVDYQVTNTTTTQTRSRPPAATISMPTFCPAFMSNSA
jgi:outer membrane receptor protein involved in Fe transport